MTLHRFPILASTNDLALDWIRCGRMSVGDVIVAEEQTAGRGRPGRQWSSGRGGLWVTAALPFSAALVGWTSLAAGLAAAWAVRDMGAAAGVKWPNDVVLNGGKLGGVLVETCGGGMAAVGIGINVANRVPEPDPLRMPAVRLADYVGDAEPTRLLEALIPRLSEAWKALTGDVQTLRVAWEAMDTTRGRPLTWCPNPDAALEAKDGLALGVEDDGALRLRLADGRVVRAAVGEVRFA